MEVNGERGGGAGCVCHDRLSRQEDRVIGALRWIRVELVVMFVW